MPLAAPPPSRPPRAAQLGQAGAALAMFLCGYLAFRTDDWRLTVVFSLLSVGAAVLASRFTALGR
jgi:hypothetical protein